MVLGKEKKINQRKDRGTDSKRRLREEGGRFSPKVRGFGFLFTGKKKKKNTGKAGVEYN